MLAYQNQPVISTADVTAVHARIARRYALPMSAIAFFTPREDGRDLAAFLRYHALMQRSCELVVAHIPAAELQAAHPSLAFRLAQLFAHMGEPERPKIALLSDARAADILNFSLKSHLFTAVASNKYALAGTYAFADGGLTEIDLFRRSISTG